jgi:O-antigen/teichoic acid export membrane protein
VFLFGVDSFTNLVDYGFHVYLGRVLLPAEFAIVQTINSVLLILVTAFGVMQPVVARFVAEAEAGQGGGPPPQPAAASSTAVQSRVVFQSLFRVCAAAGLLLSALAWLGRDSLALWLNVPTGAVGLSAVMILLALVRPVVGGMLQGQERFLAFGSTRSIHAVARFGVAVVLLGLGGGAVAAIAAFPISGILALVGGLLFLGVAVWRPGAPLPRHVWHDAFRLSAAAFVAFAAYMSMLNSDLIWVNRNLGAETAGVYATAVLLRRVLALMPGAVLVVMYPRVVSKVTRGQLPDSILWKAALVVSGSTLALTGLYFAFGQDIILLAFGESYGAAAPLLGWMGIGMLGYGLASIWVNLSLATRPLPFVSLLAVLAILEHALLARLQDNVFQATATFLGLGWALALGGLLVYLLILRPGLVRRPATR